MSDFSERESHCARGCSVESDSANRYRTFARMTADWFWELDEKLCFVFHDGASEPLAATSHDDILGLNQLEAISCLAIPDSALENHKTGMLNRQRVDEVIEFAIDQGSRFVRIVAEPQFNESGVFTGYLGCGRDVTDSRLLKKRLAHLATHDDLTGVFNRREFENELHKRVSQRTSSNDKETLCYIDLDRFKLVNDTAGHLAGDQLLRELSEIMRRHVCGSDMLARLGGDEFGLILSSNVQSAQQVCERLIDAISRHEFQWESDVYKVGASIGIVEISKQLGDSDTHMARADAACYSAKKNGRNQCHVSDKNNQQHQGMDRLVLIKKALEDQRYRLLMQPIVSNSSAESVQRYELLIRLECHNGNLLEPGEFMPLAKQFSLMRELDCWVVENAFVGLKQLRDSGEDIAFSINLSASTLADPSCLEQIEHTFRESELPGCCICFEITESSAIRNIDDVVHFMDKLSECGVEFALDDFGNGLSSFTYLQSLPIDYLKIDGALIRKISSDSVSFHLTETFHELSKKLGIKTVAESVEDESAINSVKRIGIDYMQGFGVSSLVELSGFLDKCDNGLELRSFQD